MGRKASVKVYHGYGHTHNMHVFGHVFKKKPPALPKNSYAAIKNIYHLLRLFFVEPLPRTDVILQAEGQQVAGKTADDGFFKFDWVAQQHISAGWHSVSVTAVNKNGTGVGKGEGEVFIPHVTQYGFISDVDDTILVSHSGTLAKRLKELLVKAPASRELFADVALHYSLLAAAHTEAGTPNPFFYVSSSEWNLYDYLHGVFLTHRLPEGVFLLNQVKRWYELWTTGKTKHEGKLLRILRILTAFPKQQFVLLGDNSQQDPEIYKMLVEKYPKMIHAVYIRNVSEKNTKETIKALETIRAAGKAVCFFKESREAIQHSRSIGLID